MGWTERKTCRYLLWFSTARKQIQNNFSLQRNYIFPRAIANDLGPTSNFRAIVEYHRELVARDGEDDEAGPINGTVADPDAIRFTLKQLFDPANAVIEGWNNAQRMTFDEELDVYDLLNVDAEGEIDEDAINDLLIL